MKKKNKQQKNSSRSLPVCSRAVRRKRSSEGSPSWPSSPSLRRYYYNVPSRYRDAVDAREASRACALLVFSSLAHSTGAHACLVAVSPAPRTVQRAALFVSAYANLEKRPRKPRAGTSPCPLGRSIYLHGSTLPAVWTRTREYFCCRRQRRAAPAHDSVDGMTRVSRLLSALLLVDETYR